ncbi:MAG: septal ring lytic transglycosylase RlpA family protein [Actinomycetota bacterium]
MRYLGRVTILGALLAALLVPAASTPAVSTPANPTTTEDPAILHPHERKWWQYDPDVWGHSWKAHASLRRAYKRWVKDQERGSDEGVRASAERDFRKQLEERHLDLHFHDAISTQAGTASWYSDRHGACGKRLKGFYAASRTLPCGTTVSVRSGGRYVFVTILDRGPFTGGSRILDLSKKAFRRLGPIGAGVIHIKATRLRG